MLRIFIVWLITLALLLTAGCSDSYPPSSLEPETKVSKTGFTVSVGGITATGPAGVAPVGTEVTLREVPTPPEFAELELRGSPVVDISLAGEAQPAVPVTLSWTIPAGIPPASVAFIISEGAGQPWRGIPVTIAGNQATVRIDHFSLGWFGDGTKLVQRMADVTNAYLGQTYSAPASCVQKAQINGFDIAVTNSRTDYVHACIRAEGGKLVVTAASNSPYVFPVRVQHFATMRTEGVPPSLESLVTMTVARNLHGDKWNGYLLPGGSVSAEYQSSDLEANPEFQVLTGEMDPSLGLIGIALAGAKMLVPQGESLDTVLTRVELAECVANILRTAGTKSVVGAGEVMPGVLNCVSAEASALDSEGAAFGLSVGTAVITSLAGYLTTQVRGIGDALRGGSFVLTATTSILRTPSPSARAGWLPCANAIWALEGTDRKGTVVFARCGDAIGLYADGQKISSWHAEESFPFGTNAVSSDGSRRIIVSDARSEEYLQFQSASGQGSVTRLLTVTRRYPTTG